MVPPRYAPSGFAEMDPWQAFFMKYVPDRFKLGGIIKCTDVKVHFRRVFTLAGQC